MARSMFAALVLAACVVAINAAGDPSESLPGVVDLTPENFNQVMNGAKAALVEFYAPWCGHCKHLVPEYKKLAEIVQNDGKLKSRVVIAKVNADAHRELGERFGVRGFPTIKFFPRGVPADKDSAQDYNQARSADKFLEYIKEKLEEDKGFARVEALDALVADFASASDKPAIIKKVSAAVAELSGEEKDNGELYVKLMEKAAEKGGDYLSKEKARLEKMLSSGNVAQAKVSEFSRKASILGAFVGDE